MENLQSLTYNVTKSPSSEIFPVQIELGQSGNNTTVKNSSDCELILPTFEESFEAFRLGAIISYGVGAVFVVATIGIFADTALHIFKNVPVGMKSHSAFVVVIYPVVSMVTYCAITVPRAYVLADIFTQSMFVACIYQYFCLLIAYCGGEAELIVGLRNNSLNLRVPPCCCYPCCKFPSPFINSKHLKLIRLSVLQLPIIQSIIYLILLVMWANEILLYGPHYLYLQPVVAVSIMFAFWGVIMTIRFLSDFLKGLNIKKKFYTLQAVVLLAKTQGLISAIIIWTYDAKIDCPLSIMFYGHLTYNSLMLIEMTILSLIARSLYKRDFKRPFMEPMTGQNQFYANVDRKISLILKEGGVVNPTFSK